MFDWTIALPVFLTASVEWVEAFTIVLAVSLSIGWRSAIGAALSALVVLAGMTVLTGGALMAGIDIAALRLAIGVLLLLFGVRWLAKAIARHTGLIARRDEAREFAKTKAELNRGDWFAGWLIAFKSVLLEGLEVWLIVVALGVGHPWLSSIGAAIAALLVVAAAGSLVRAPLALVPENAIKFVVGGMIVAFGTFWTLEAIGGPGVWPGGDWSLPMLAAFYLAGGWGVSIWLRHFSAQAIGEPQ